MTFSEAVLPEFDLELANTRRVLARVPSDKGAWKPHPKSFALGHLAQLVSGLPGWLTNIVTQTELDLAKGPGYSLQKTQTLLDIFDKNVRDARAAIAAASDEDLDVKWSLKMGDRVLATDARRSVVRNTISHLVHHRAQLGVYLRLLDLPVPSAYGPTADEGWG